MILSDRQHFIRNHLRQFASRPGLQYLLFTAVVLRLCYLMLMLGQITPDGIMNLAPDTIRYVNIGRGLADFSNADEGALVIFGPGYGGFLAVNFILFGVNPFAVLLAQILMSSFACLMLYRLGKELTGMTSVGYIAGYLSALSFTSISLATFILSDTLFFFLFLWGNLAFVLALKNNRRGYFIFSGLCIGLAILVRSIGQFWPIIMLIIALFQPRDEAAFPYPHSRFKLVGRSMWAILMALLVMAFWAGRNYAVHGLPMIAFTSAGGPANVARLTQAEVEKRDPNDVAVEWETEYRQNAGVTDFSYADRYRIFSAATFETWGKYPRQMFDTYRRLVWQNLHESNELYRQQLPTYANFVLDKMYWMRNQKLHFLDFWLSVAGFCLLVILRKWRAAFFLGIVYLYFVSMIGFTQWQGSRLFYPGQMAASLLTAYFLVWVSQAVRWGGQRLRKT